MSEISLGKQIKYKDSYDNSLLFPIKRSLNRNKIITQAELPFNGYDLWNCYEVSWLNQKGRPEVRIVHFIVSAKSECLIESKSIKLYLNSFNNTKFTSEREVVDLIQTDLSNVSGLQVEVSVYKLDHYQNQSLKLFDGILLDEIDVEITDYQVNSDLLKIESDLADNFVEEILYSNLLKSNCLVTGQPDWASVQIKYSGRKINHLSLLKYLISYRNHNGFHEDCIEHIFVDILENCKPQELTIYAKYTRRGGVDINPFRTNLDLKNTEIIKIRDVRQ
ncbi:MAG: NADPH-dependent 7-cyano-7-deazaguanine reductase QueF [Rickettsiaceae bacterium]